jgi:hypothetical protein
LTGLYHVEGPCPVQPAFVCSPVTLPRDGDEIFRLDVIVVNPGSQLSPGSDLPALPPAAARQEVTIHRQSE